MKAPRIEFDTDEKKKTLAKRLTNPPLQTEDSKKGESHKDGRLIIALTFRKTVPLDEHIALLNELQALAIEKDDNDLLQVTIIAILIRIIYQV